MSSREKAVISNEAEFHHVLRGGPGLLLSRRVVRQPGSDPEEVLAHVLPG